MLMNMSELREPYSEFANYCDVSRNIEVGSFNNSQDIQREVNKMFEVASKMTMRGKLYLTIRVNVGNVSKFIDIL